VGNAPKRSYDVVWFGGCTRPSETHGHNQDAVEFPSTSHAPPGKPRDLAASGTLRRGNGGRYVRFEYCLPFPRSTCRWQRTLLRIRADEVVVEDTEVAFLWNFCGNHYITSLTRASSYELDISARRDRDCKCI
jgi:hypothetical protein